MDFFIQIVAAAGGSTLIVLGVLKVFGNKFLDNLFKKSIEKFKFKINLEFDRISKINQKEFEVLPILWQKLIDHKKNLEWHTSEFFIDINLNALSPNELKDFVDRLRFEPVIKNSIIDAPDKNQVYRSILLHNGRFILQKSYLDYLYYFQNNKIFLTDEIKSIGEEIAEFLKSTLTVYTLFLAPQPKEVLESARKDFEKNFNKFDNLGELIKKRLKFPIS